jgi:ribosomal protein S18 acetylase RimI-like enzyme
MMLSLRSRMQSNNAFRIRSARDDDWEPIERFLNHAERHYKALEWWTIQEWLGTPGLLLAVDKRDQVVGLTLSIVNDGPVAWLRVISLGSEKCLAPLLNASAAVVVEQGCTGLAFLGDEGWISSKLRQAGFARVNRVITLRRFGAWPLQLGPPDLLVEPASLSDIDPILHVDHAAFAPMWWYDRDILVRALDLAHSYRVAYLNGECAGYQLSTLNQRRGHIVRLAVQPRLQRQGIGGRLLSDAMQSFEAAQAEVVTVNTQEDNLNSLRLYSRFSFERVGKPWTVWFRSMEQ